MDPDTAVRDGSRININDARDVDYWSQAFNIDEATLREAVARVGPKIEDVRDELDGIRSPRRFPGVPTRPSLRRKG
jgi:hypothetical protein